MQFPSQSIKDWCKNIQKLIDAPRENKTTYGDGFCICEVDRAILYASFEQQAQLASGLFWSVWIDQIMYYVLVDGGITDSPSEPQLYALFRLKFRFPKLYNHLGPGHSSPHLLLSENMNYQQPNNELLEEDKKDFWCNVREWLTSIHRDDVVAAAIKAFREDIETRFGNEYGFLADNIDC